MTDEMDGKARKMSVTSSDGRNSMCIVAVHKSFDTEVDRCDPSRGQLVLQRFVRVSGSDVFQTRRCGRSIWTSDKSSRQSHQEKPCFGADNKDNMLST